MINKRKNFFIVILIIIVVLIAALIFFVFLKLVTCDREPTTAEEIAVYALLKYVNEYPCFDSLEALTHQQKQALNNSLEQLKGKNFVVFNREVIILGNENDVQVYNEEDLVYLQIFDDGKSKGKILLADLTDLNKQEDCSIYDVGGTEQDPWHYIMCYAGNYAKQSPDAWIGEEAELVDYVHNYLRDNVDNFDLEYEFDAYGDTIRADNLNISSFIIFITEPILQYNKTVIKDSFKTYENLIFDIYDKDSFFVIEKDILWPMTTYSVSKILEDFQTVKGEGKHIAMAESDIIGFADEEKKSSAGCDTITSTGLPCNNKIDVFIGFLSPALGSYDLISIDSYQKLEKLGYDVNITTYEDVSDLTSEILASKGKILHTSFHGKKDGILGPTGCVDVGKVGDPEEMEKIVKAKYGRYYSDCIVFGSNGGWPCNNGEAPVYMNFPKCSLTKKALHTGTQCYGYASRADSLSWVLRNSKYESWGPAVWDIQLLKNYFLGIGPSIVYYDDYPPKLVTKKHNTKLENYEGYGKPKYHEVKVTKDMVKGVMTCENDESFIRTPCFLKAFGNLSVHLFPYVEDLTLTDGGFKIDFSDEVTEPKIELKDEDGENIEIEEINGRETGKELEYSISSESEFEIISKDKWESYTEEEKENVKIGEIVISDALANVEKNDVLMIGNPLANQTKDSDFYDEEFWLYDDYFWIYNARAYGEHIHQFRAKIPYESLCSNEEYSTSEWEHNLWIADKTEIVWKSMIFLDYHNEEKLRQAIKEKGNSALEEISDLTCLERLCLYNTNISDISSLKELINLKWLDLAGTNVSDISILKEFKDLEVLCLGNTNISDISSLKELINLKWLDLGNTNVSDISALRNLRELKYLNLGQTKVTDLSPIRGLTNLEVLALHYPKTGNIPIWVFCDCRPVFEAFPDTIIDCIDFSGGYYPPDWEPSDYYQWPDCIEIEI